MKRGPRHQGVDLDVLVQRVRAVADGADAVERGHAEAAVKLPSEPPPALPSPSVSADVGGHRLRGLEQLDHGRAALERRAIESALHFEPRAPAICGCNDFIARAIRSASARVLARASMVARASSGTTLARVPPRITPTLTVTPWAGS